jgi:hypothetical protein
VNTSSASAPGFLDADGEDMQIEFYFYSALGDETPHRRAVEKE